MKSRITTTILVLLTFSFTLCKSQEKKTELSQIPESFKIFNETIGDLDNDGVSEKVVVFDTDTETDYGTERQLFIYKKNNDTWELWKKATGPILASKEGGMMGEPFEGISIERNCIVIKHFGGSLDKWNSTHRFRYQSGEFQLIGATITSGYPCDQFTTFDYNLSNGMINYQKEIDDCENESLKVEKEEFIQKLETLPKMNGFHPLQSEIKVKNPEITMYY